MSFDTIQRKEDLPSTKQELRELAWNLIINYRHLSDKHLLLLRSKFGKTSERLSDDGSVQIEMQELLNQIQEQMGAGEQKSEDEEKVEIRPYKRRRKHPGRNSIPDNIARHEKILDVPEQEKQCECCGRQKVALKSKRHTVVERIPAHYEVTEYVRPIYVCSYCKCGISIADPAHTPIPKGLADVQLLSFVILSKYLYHLTLYRIQRQIYHESQIWFTRSTMIGWIRKLCVLLQPLYLELLALYKASPVKHADESFLKVRYTTIKGSTHQGCMWVGVNSDATVAVFRYDKNRNSKAARAFLAGSSKGDYLMTDDCACYDQAINSLGLIALICMAHIRRKFDEALSAGYQKDYARWILRKIAQLYRIERLADRSMYDRGELRKRFSVTIMNAIKIKLMEPGFTLLPQSKIGTAINYFLNNWDKAIRFIDSADLPIDNNVVERIIRALAIGRNNWIVAGSEKGAKWIAILYTLIATCKLNKINPHAYISDVIQRIGLRAPGQSVRDLKPCEWAKQKSQTVANIQYQNN